jgi:hypothetical protein
MFLDNHPKGPTILLQLGLVSLILANLAHRFVHPSARLPESLLDALTGFLYGVAIAAMLLSVIRGRRGRSDRNAG